MSRKPAPIETRFWPKVEVPEDPDGCWGWDAATNEHGYGVIRPERRGQGGPTAKASRVSWEIHNGPIPEGLDVLHSCDNPPCTNPRHLFLGTHLDNMRDMFAKGRRTAAIGGGNHGTAKLTPAIVAEIRATYRGRRGERKALLEKLGITKGTLQALLEGKTWRHVP